MKAKNPIRAVKSEALKSIHKARRAHRLTLGWRTDPQTALRQASPLPVCAWALPASAALGLLGTCERQTQSFPPSFSPRPHRSTRSDAWVLDCRLCLMMPSESISTELGLQTSFILCGRKKKHSRGKSDSKRQVRKFVQEFTNFLLFICFKTYGPNNP